MNFHKFFNDILEHFSVYFEFNVECQLLSMLVCMKSIQMLNLLGIEIQLVRNEIENLALQKQIVKQIIKLLLSLKWTVFLSIFASDKRKKTYNSSPLFPHTIIEMMQLTFAENTCKFAVQSGKLEKQ